MKMFWRYLYRQNFFGLSNEYIENVYEQFFYMKYYGGWSLFELYNLPIGLRNWFVKKLSEQIEKEADEVKKATKK
jgi:hypothetical protein